MNDNEIYAKAADILAEGGHCKNALEQGTAHCAVGALSVADTGYVWGSDLGTLTRLVRRAEEHLGLPGRWADMPPWPVNDSTSLVDWNNAPERTGEDVILLFKELAHA